MRLEGGSFGTLRAGYALARTYGDVDVYAAVRGRSWRLLALTAAANALSFGVGLLLQ